MVNSLVLIGRIKSLEKKDLKDDKEKTEVELKLIVQRQTKNIEGVYINDEIPVLLTDVIAEKTTEYLKPFDLVGIKGSLQTRHIESSNSDESRIIVIAEKITFLSSKKDETK